MARIKYLLLLVTIGVSLEHVYGEKHSPSKVPRSLNPIDQPKIGKRGVAETLIQQLSEKDHNDENTSVKYEVINSAVQQDPVYGQQYETVSNPLESQVNKTQNYYGNQYSTLSNAPSLALSPPLIRQESASNVLSHNIPPNSYNSYINPYPIGYNYPGLYVDTRQNQLSAQSEPLILSNAQTFYPPLFPNYQNYLINAPQYVAPTLPASPSPSLDSGNPIPIYQNVQSVLPSLPTVPVGGQVFNLPSVANLEPQNFLPAVAQKPIQPIVTKDIYFHAAPPDYDEAPAVPVLPPKRTYKIIFIKLPSQESRNSALLQNLYRNYAAREDKTLIYVLVKKPEEQTVIVPKTTPSQHEVIFVKYKENKLNSGNIISNGVEQKIDDSLALKPGLPNGH